MADPYTQPTLPQIYAAIAEYANAITGLAAHYPAPPTIPVPPAVIIFGGAGSIVHGAGDQMWQLRPKAHLMVAMKGATRQEINRVDELLMPLVDAFAADVEDTDGFTLGGRVSRCVVADWEELHLLGYANHRYFGIPVFFDVKVHRNAVGA